jgi:rRNA-processing protein FCF1
MTEIQMHALTNVLTTAAEEYIKRELENLDGRIRFVVQQVVFGELREAARDAIRKAVKDTLEVTVAVRTK